MKLSRTDLELYAEDILINVLKRERFGYAVRDTLADKLEQMLIEIEQTKNRLEARKLLKKAVKKTNKVNVD